MPSLTKNKKGSKKCGASLEIIEQPPSAFYKDEGGKSNFMSVTVRLPENTGLSSRLPLSAKLHFESGLLVTEDSCLNILGNKYEPPCIHASGETAVFNFRVEKVSSRWDGQRFKLLVEPESEGTGIDGVFTIPFTVFSKRKVPGRKSSSVKRKLSDVSSGSEEHDFDVKKLKTTLGEVKGMGVRMDTQVQDLKAMTEELLGLVRAQSERISTLEGVLLKQQKTEQLQDESKLTKAEGVNKVEPVGAVFPVSDISALPDMISSMPVLPQSVRRPQLGRCGSSSALLHSSISGLLELDELIQEGGLGEQFDVDCVKSLSLGMGLGLGGELSSGLPPPVQPVLGQGTLSSGLEFRLF